jgi:hypothetical protein
MGTKIGVLLEREGKRGTYPVYTTNATIQSPISWTGHDTPTPDLRCQSTSLGRLLFPMVRRVHQQTTPPVVLQLRPAIRFQHLGLLRTTKTTSSTQTPHDRRSPRDRQIFSGPSVWLPWGSTLYTHPRSVSKKAATTYAFASETVRTFLPALEKRRSPFRKSGILSSHGPGSRGRALRDGIPCNIMAYIQHKQGRPHVPLAFSPLGPRAIITASMCSPSTLNFNYNWPDA